MFSFGTTITNSTTEERNIARFVAPGFVVHP
jgi:hypothetical protein